MDDFVDSFWGVFVGGVRCWGFFNMYMFYGGINFGFMVGVNYFEGFYYKFDVISYGMYDNIG